MRKIQQNLFLYCLIVSMALAGVNDLFWKPSSQKKQQPAVWGDLYDHEQPVLPGVEQ